MFFDVLFWSASSTLDQQICWRMLQYYKDNVRKVLLVRSQLMAVVGDYSLLGTGS